MYAVGDRAEYPLHFQISFTARLNNSCRCFPSYVCTEQKGCCRTLDARSARQSKQKKLDDQGLENRSFPT